MSNLRVIKVGGSLLNLSDLSRRIQVWLQSKREATNVFLIGGGEICNELRRLDARFQLGPEFSHDCAIELMKVTAAILSRVLDTKLEPDFANLGTGRGDAVFECSGWLRSKEDQVPQTWDFTSDSISALLAHELNAELCLLKSVDRDDEDATDRCFAEFSQSVEVEFVNLRQQTS